MGARWRNHVVLPEIIKESVMYGCDENVMKIGHKYFFLARTESDKRMTKNFRSNDAA